MASQSWKEAAPSCLVSSPPPQGKQPVRPGSDWYVPTGQAWQGRKPSAEKEPGEHWPGRRRSRLIQAMGGLPRSRASSQPSSAPGEGTTAPTLGVGGGRHLGGTLGCPRPGPQSTAARGSPLCGSARPGLLLPPERRASGRAAELEGVAPMGRWQVAGGRVSQGVLALSEGRPSALSAQTLGSLLPAVATLRLPWGQRLYSCRGRGQRPEGSLGNSGLGSDLVCPRERLEVSAPPEGSRLATFTGIPFPTPLGGPHNGPGREADGREALSPFHGRGLSGAVDGKALCKPNCVWYMDRGLSRLPPGQTVPFSVSRRFSP